MTHTRPVLICVLAPLMTVPALGQEVFSPSSWAQTHAPGAQAQMRQNHADDKRWGSVSPLAFPEAPRVEFPSATQRGAVLDWPFPPNPLPVLSARVRAVFVADDDGGRATPINADQVAAWVEYTNNAMLSAGIRLEFDPAPGSGDWETLSSTLLNNLESIAHPDWPQQVVAADAIAAQTPERVTVFFRWGTHPSFATGAGFSWTDYDFIAMPGFDVTGVCGVQNIGLFAHELGHYLGLPHTHWSDYQSIAEAEADYVALGSDPEVYNADGRDDTQRDPFIRTFPTQCVLDSVTLDGDVFVLPRGNIMSYYPASQATPSQISTMRQTLLLRTGRSLAEGVSDRTLAPIEGETLASSATTRGVAFVQGMTVFHGKWTGDAQTLWIDAQPGDTLSGTISAPEAGRYRVYAAFTAAPDFAIVTHTINGVTTDPIDLYSNNVLNTGAVPLGEFDLAAGANPWVVTITGSNPLASPVRHGYGIDAILLEALCAADLAEDGQLDFDDVLAFLTAFGSMDAAADLAIPFGVFNFDDVLAFLTAFGAGCP